MSEIRKALLKLFKGVTQIQTVPGFVGAVNLSDLTCDVSPADGGAIYYGVRIRASIDSNGNGIIPIPKEGSAVVLGVIGNDDKSAFIMLYDELVKYSIVCDNILLNGENHGGLVKVDALIQRLNNIENKFNLHTHSGNNTPTQTIVTPLTTRNQLENTKVKHGGN